MKKKRKYVGAKTESWITPIIYAKWYQFWKLKHWSGETKHEVYYEKAFDVNGNGLLPGDIVRIIEIDTADKIEEIFQGNLRLKHSGYCSPHKVVKI